MRKSPRVISMASSKGKWYFTNLINFSYEVFGLVDEERAVNIVYLDFSKVFDAVFHEIFTVKQLMYGLEEKTMRYSKNCLNGWAQRTMVSHAKSSWRPVTSQYWVQSCLTPSLMICMTSRMYPQKSADDTKLGGAADMPVGHTAIHRDLNRLEKWAGKNVMYFNKGKCKVLHLGQNNPMHPYLLGTMQLESSLAENNLRLLVHTRLNMSQECALAAKAVNDTLNHFRQSIASRSRERILPLCSTLVRPQRACCV